MIVQCECDLDAAHGSIATRTSRETIRGHQSDSLLGKPVLCPRAHRQVRTPADRRVMCSGTPPVPARHGREFLARLRAKPRRMTWASRRLRMEFMDLPSACGWPGGSAFPGRGVEYPRYQRAREVRVTGRWRSSRPGTDTTRCPISRH